ncbi:MAG: FAD-dependent oxidoreductase [Deltaproteobacteria bacterium]|nr:FAD-dependent oxidoreductase [Deltaproteobacteria bacterium]
MPTVDVDTLIIGAGLTGLSAALHLGDGYAVVERAGHVGGLAHTHVEQGHHFDITGHWLHLRTAEVRALVDRLLGDEMVARDRRARVYSHGGYTRYPFQANTFGLPPKVAAECVMGFVRARCWDRLSAEPAPPLPPPRTFADFILQRLGDGIARHFMFPYNQKIWTVHPTELDASWCDRFVPVPSLEDVILGALGQAEQRLGYNAQFAYPRRGGIARLPQALRAELRGPVELNRAISGIDLEQRIATTGEGVAYRFRHLVSSAPLNRLLAMLRSLPDLVRDAAPHLRHTAVTYFDVAARGANPDQPHWSYVPEPDKPFYRVGSFTAVEPAMSPPDTRSFYVEISHQGEALPLADAEQRVVEQLCQMGLIGSPSDVLFVRRRTIPVAYVLEGADVAPARRTILEYLRQQRVISTGRYGAWTYAAMEDAIVDGMNAAKQIAQWRAS